MALERAVSVNLDAMWASIEAKTGRTRADMQLDDALRDQNWLEDRHRENTEYRREMSRKLSDIPEIFRDAKIAGYRYHDGNARAIGAASRVIASNGRLGLGIHGQPGVGKSHLAAIIANEAIEQGLLTIYTSVRRMLDTIKDTYHAAHRDEKDATELKLIQRYASIPVLVLNDLGKEPLTKWSIEMLFAIFDDRWEQGRRLILTANLDWAELHKRYTAPMPSLDESLGPAMLDRIAGMTEMPWVEIRGESGRWGV